MGNIGKATEPRSINNQWQPTQVTDIYLTVPCTPFINRFMYRQHVPVYDLEKRRDDCLIKWLIMLGFIDLRGPRVCRRSTPVLFFEAALLIGWNHFSQTRNKNCVFISSIILYSVYLRILSDCPLMTLHVILNVLFSKIFLSLKAAAFPLKMLLVIVLMISQHLTR